MVFVGFVVFIAVSVAAHLGLEVALDWWWSSEGLDPNERPPLNEGGKWLVSLGIGLGAGALVTKVLGKD